MIASFFVALINRPSNAEQERNAREHLQAARDRAANYVHPSLRSTSTFVPLSPEAIALGKKAYLGPMTTKRRKALQNARRKRKQS